MYVWFILTWHAHFATFTHNEQYLNSQVVSFASMGLHVKNGVCKNTENGFPLFLTLLMSTTNITIFFIYIVLENEVGLILANKSVSEISAQTLGNTLLIVVL